jgi:acyl-CoA synthetase (AMP-forming)/AMP-acid ligase II/3-oxoacyl-(acyl-carrier-protein) synthase
MSAEPASHAMLPEYTLVDILRWRASFTPDDVPFRFFREGTQETSRISYREFHDAANKIAAFLCARGKTGQPVLLLYPEGIEFAVALLGCMIAGSLAVPIPAPDYSTLRRTRERLVNITNHTGASLLLTSIVENNEHLYAELAASDSQVEWVLHSAVVFDQRRSQANIAQYPGPGINTIAFIQFTSGSTGSPRGISISQGNLVHQLSALACSGQYEPNSLIVNWMPHFHDFGLIYGILFPLFVGIQCLTMPPIAFLRRPIRWLQLISDHKATHSAAPNFAYDYCCRAVSKRELVGIDFTTWRAALVGAEPIDPLVMRRFSALVKDAGFDLRNFCPSFGLAESTLGVTHNRQWDSPILYEVDAAGLLKGDVRTASVDGGLSRTIVGCGTPVGSDTKVLIVDPITLTTCAQDKVGEVWVASGSVAIGYWRSAQETAETFQAHLANGDGPFLRTGDLGFFYNGELFITGRLKELIIIGGQNYYPQDIERTAESSHSALRPQSCAAFSVTNGARESVVLLVEARVKAQRFSEVMASIRNAVSLSHGVDISRIVLTKPGCLSKTSSGKLQRRQCRQNLLEGTIEILAEDTAEGSSFATHLAVPAEDIAQVAALDELRLSYEEVSSIIRASISSLLGIDPASIDEHRPFAEYGLASLHIIRACTTIEEKLRRPISPVLLFEHPTLQSLSKALSCVNDAIVNEASALSSPLGEPIAIIGLGCRFPGASTPEKFWQLLISGGQSIDVVPSDRWNLERFYSAGAFGPRQMNTRFGGFLNDVDLFDRRLFGISKLEAVHMDPQQRILLEVVWEALEDAGIDSQRLAKTATGVFIGISNSDYRGRLYRTSEGISPYAGPGGALSIAANRISYSFDLRGPSVAVDTACSSSLVALHLACQSLRTSESDAAVVGGVNLILAPEPTVAFSQAGMMSPDGRCKTFDTKANGYVRSEGCGVVILRTLSSALKNGDRIIALIHGSAVNQDGHSNGLTAPNPSAQRDVMLRAFKNAKVQPFDIGYIEAHGTGTALGDVIEMDSIINVAGRKVEGKGKCFVGSVKANIGHLEAAAGIAGILKIALMFENRMISPHINLDELNPKIQLEGTRIEIPREPLSWPGTSALMAGVSSFGFGGTNSHVVIGPPPARESADPAVESQSQLLTLSTDNHAALLDLAHRYVGFLDKDPESFADVCFTANTGRARLSHRIALIANSGPDAAGVLRKFIDGVQCDAVFSGAAVQRTPDIHLHCGGIERELSSELLAVLPCLGIYHHGIKRMLGPQFVQSWATGFAAEYALVHMWKHLGVTPSSFSGDGIGGTLAECLSSRRSISEAVHLGIATNRSSFSGGGATKGVDSKSQKLNISADCSIRDFLSTAAQLFVVGFNLDLLEFHAAGRSKIRLPAYPFQRERYWISKHDTGHDL